MGAVHGRSTHFELENLAGASQDISNQCRSAALDEEAELLDVTAFKDTAKKYIPGFSDRKFSFEANYSSTLYTHLANILGVGNPTGGTENEGFDFIYGPEGNATGKLKIIGKAILVKLNMKPAVSDAIPQSFELQIIGGVTLGTFA